MSTQSNTQNVLVGIEMGAARIFVKSGGEIDIESGGAFKIAGTNIATELALISGLTSTATELNQNDLSVIGAVLKFKKIHVIGGTSAEVDSTIDLPAHAIVLDAFVNVTTAEVTGGTKTLDVGLLSGESGGDADGFLDGVDLSSTGIKRGKATITVGGTESYFSANTRGVLLSYFLAGSNSGGDVGTYYEFPHLSDSVTAKSISYSRGGTLTEFVGDIFIQYIELA